MNLCGKTMLKRACVVCHPHGWGVGLMSPADGGSGGPGGPAVWGPADVEASKNKCGFDFSPAITYDAIEKKIAVRNPPCATF